MVRPRAARGGFPARVFPACKDRSGGPLAAGAAGASFTGPWAMLRGPVAPPPRATGFLASTLLAMIERVLLASPRGYCAGVERAVETVERALELYGTPVYVRKQIVHNLHVV